ncbi:PadR family transcriptional regulator [Demequina litorisediminis]|uniref:PadR family transcriptional regulator n=1 Tax=Demequina litorisediminis TaxID=1849022 RepID=A0ABQ6IHW5_9MICO|nr:PadR family transcriptional regulator [Demequina litorisediminis]GMA37316.1 PadR family transcriptional regulator [Demequina litorisediminis]
MPERLTPLAVCALALLAERPMHPYEIAQLLRARGQDQDVKLRIPSLYHAIERLERDGLIEVSGVDREGNRPERTTYRLLKAGRDAMERQVIVWLQAPRAEFPVLPVAVGEAHFLTRAEVERVLAERRDAVARERAAVRVFQEAALDKGVPRRMLLGKEFTLHRLDAEPRVGRLSPVRSRERGP